MKDSVRRQVRNGLRWGGGLAVFLVAMLPLVDGLRRTVWAVHARQPVEPIGWLELVVAAALFASTANVWVYYLLGSMVFGAIKGIALIAMGGGVAPLQTSELLLFIFVAILLLVSIVLRPTTLLDRITLTLFVFSVGWRADNGLFVPDPSLFVGLMFLFTSWCVHYWKRRHNATTEFQGAAHPCSTIEKEYRSQTTLAS
jgi:hypothetical protein